MIDPPRRQEDYEDRGLDCEAAMETMFQAMCEEMQAVGWTPNDIDHAILKLLAARRKTLYANAKVEAELAIMRAMARSSR